MHLERLSFDEFKTSDLDTFEDRSVYQTSSWLRFLEETQKCEPVVAALIDGNDIVGYFTGCMFRKFNMRFLGSPFPGWTTSYMGFNLHPGVSRKRALEALSRFAFRDLKCVHFELMDRSIQAEDAHDLGFNLSNFNGFEIDLTLSEDELFMNMDSDYRRCTRNAEKNGVTIEIATDIGFADDYHQQLCDVFAKQSLVPTYSVDRVRSLFTHLQPTGMLLALRARDADGRCIATGIFLGTGSLAFFWGGASWRQDQNKRPNHAIQWHSIRHWKSRNFKSYDMGGGGRYKANFGGKRISVPWLRKSKYPVLELPRQVYKTFFKKAQQVVGNTGRKSIF